MYRPDHPRALRGGWIKRALVVWWLETGKDLDKGQDLHHRNEIKTDDRFENLEPKSKSLHMQDHGKRNMFALVCNMCALVFLHPEKGLGRGEGKFCSPECYHKHSRRRKTQIIYAEVV